MAPGPPAPTGVTASDGAFTDHVHVAWNASTGAAGYWVYRNTVSSPPAGQIAFTNLLTYDDFSAVSGQLYFYWVRAIAGGGAVSPYSTPDAGYASVATPTPTVPPTATPTPTSPGFSASFTYAPTIPFAGQTVQFTDTSAGATSWLWTFGDSTTSSLRNPTHVYMKRGTYAVNLQVGNGLKVLQTSATLKVNAPARPRLD